MGRNKVVKRFTVDTNWTAPAGVTSVKVRLVQNYENLMNNGGLALTFSILGSNRQFFGWGYGGNGSLGQGDIVSKSTPTLITGGVLNLRGWSTHSSSNFSLYLSDDGSAYGAGLNGDGQLGNADTIARSVPTLVVGGLKFVQLTGSNGEAFGLTADGTAWAWGRNSAGGVGDGTVTPRSSPVQVVGGLKFKKLIGLAFNGINTSCLALTSDGTAYAWGGNDYGQLGLGDTIPRSSPVAILGGLKFSDLVGGGGGFVLGLTTSGQAYAWGSNSTGQLGTGDLVFRSSPVAVLGGLTFQAIAAGGTDDVPGSGDAHCHGLDLNGTVYSWGGNAWGQLALNNLTIHSSPVVIFGGGVYAGIFAGGRQFFVVTSDGHMYGCGQNSRGELGIGNVVDRSIPTLLVGGARLFLPKTKEVVQAQISVVPGTVYPISISTFYASFGTTVLESAGNRFLTLEYET